MPEEKIPTIGLRPPHDLMEWLKREADANQRSLNGQAVWALQQFRKLQEPASAQPT